MDPEEKVIKKRGKRHFKPTIKMIRYVQNKNLGMSKAQAARKAGYSRLTSYNPGRNIESTAPYKELVRSWEKAFDNAGLNQEYIILKFKEWLEAVDKNDDPDYETQIKAYDRWKDNIGETKPQENIKRKIELVEFALGPNYKKDDL